MPLVDKSCVATPSTHQCTGCLTSEKHAPFLRGLQTEISCCCVEHTRYKWYKTQYSSTSYRVYHSRNTRTIYRVVGLSLSSALQSLFLASFLLLVGLGFRPVLISLGLRAFLNICGPFWATTIRCNRGRFLLFLLTLSG